MTQSNAERQAAYRARHLKDLDATCERLNLIISMNAKKALERLSSYYAVTQRAMLERLLAEAQRAAISGLTGKEQDAYYDGLLIENRAPVPTKEKSKQGTAKRVKKKR